MTLRVASALVGALKGVANHVPSPPRAPSAARSGPARRSSSRPRRGARAAHARRTARPSSASPPWLRRARGRAGDVAEPAVWWTALGASARNFVPGKRIKKSETARGESPHAFERAQQGSALELRDKNTRPCPARGVFRGRPSSPPRRAGTAPQPSRACWSGAKRSNMKRSVTQSSTLVTHLPCQNAQQSR